MKKTILYPFVGDSVGGSQLNTINIIKHLKKKNYKLIVCLMNEGPLSEILIKNDIKFRILFPKVRFRNTFLFHLKVFYFITKFLVHKNIDMIHTNDIRMHYFWIPFCFILKKKHIWHQHSAYFSRKNIIFSKVSHKILTVSDFCKESFTNEMSKRAIVIKNLFETDLNKVKKIKFRKSRVVTFIGNNNIQKRLNIFLGIAEKLVQHYKNNILIVFVGNIKNFDKIIEKYNINNYRFYQFSQEVETIIKSSTLLIAPSINEGFGRIIVESMRLDTLVLASKSGGHKEIINENKTGFFAQPDNIEDFYKKAVLILSLSQKEKKEIASAAKKFAKLNFKQTDVLKKIIKIYK